MSVKDTTTNFKRFVGSVGHYLLLLNFFWLWLGCIVVGCIVVGNRVIVTSNRVIVTSNRVIVTVGLLVGLL